MKKSSTNKICKLNARLGLVFNVSEINGPKQIPLVFLFKVSTTTLLKLFCSVFVNNNCDARIRLRQILVESFMQKFIA